MKEYYSKDGIVIYHGDALEVLPTLPKFDLLLTDPPYGIGYGGKKNSVGGTEGRARNGWKTWHTDWDDKSVPNWLIEMALESATDAIIWGGNYFKLPTSMGWLVWDKGQRDFSLEDAELAWTSRNQAIRVFTYSRAKTKADGRSHPTQKPLALIRWCINLMPEAKTVLDPFMGSGTTLVACKLLGLKATGIELSEEYCEVAVRRLRQGVLFPAE